MKEFDEFDVQEERSVDLMPYIRKAFKNWKKILVWGLIGAAFGIIIGISTPRSYTTKSIVAPEIVTRATTGGLSSLASMAGINVNNLAMTDAMHPDMYPAIINSSSFYIKLFDLPVVVETKDSLVHTDLYDYIVNYTKKPWFGYLLGAPRLAINGIKSIFSKDDEEEVEGHASVDSLRLTRQQEGVIKQLSKSVVATVDKKSYVLQVKATMQDPVICSQVANAVVENLKDFVVQYRTEKARENMDYYKKIYEETRNDYLAAQRAYSYYVDTHQGVANKSSLVYQTHLQNEAQLRYSMYSQTAQNLLNAEAKVQQEAPVLVIIQPGIAPHIGHPSKVRLAIIWFILGVILGFSWYGFMSDYIKKKKVGAQEVEAVEAD